MPLPGICGSVVSEHLHSSILGFHIPLKDGLDSHAGLLSARVTIFGGNDSRSLSTQLSAYHHPGQA